MKWTIKQFSTINTAASRPTKSRTTSALESIGMREGCRARFWECLRDEIAKEVPAVVVGPKQMNDAELREFGRSTMPFGVHLGKRIDNVLSSTSIGCSGTRPNFSLRFGSI